MNYTFAIISLLLIQYSVVAQNTVGLINYQSGNTDGYLLFSPMTSTKTYLINKCGEKVHEWNTSTNRPALSCHLMNDGSLLRTRKINNINFNEGGSGDIIEKFDWNDNLTWSYGQKAKSSVIEINFCNYVGNQILKLDSVKYKNALNQDFSVTKFKYYIANIVLSRKDGKLFTDNHYYLIDEEKPSSKNIVLGNIPQGEYVSVNFTVGVDSIDNCSGAQSDALDPINGMFWTWNTGYIFMKLEGSSEFSSSPNAMLEYHIGGFKKPNNCIRTISLPLNNAILNTNSINKTIQIKTDILEILKTPISIDFSALSSVTDFKNATTLADNYSDMFSIFEIK